MRRLPAKYLLTKLPFEEWNEKVWTTIFSVNNLAKGESVDVFYFVSAIGQALGNLEESWKEEKERENILGFLDSCLIHSFEAMVRAEDKDRKEVLSAFLSLLMNFIESFRMTHNLESSKVVRNIWERSKVKKEED